MSITSVTLLYTISHSGLELSNISRVERGVCCCFLPLDIDTAPCYSYRLAPGTYILRFGFRIEQDLGIWNHLGVVVNWLLGACKMHLGKLLGPVESTYGSYWGPVKCTWESC
jgi:hypothetical protein